MPSFLRLILVALAVTLVGCHCAPNPHPAGSPIGPSWRDEYTQHKPDPRWNTVISTYYIDKRFNAQRKSQIELACEHWNVVLNGRFDIRLANESATIDDDFIALHEAADALPFFFVWEDATNPYLPAGALAYVEELGSPVVHLIDGRLNFTFMPEVVVMHEMGHAFGLDHTDVPNTLMSRTYETQPHCVDEFTVRTFAAQMHWDASTLNWCPVR